MAVELTQRRVPYLREHSLSISYKGHTLNTAYRSDLICFGEVLVEAKALKELSGTEDAQMINYLRATGLHTALLLNFGKSSLEYRRLVQS